MKVETPEAGASAVEATIVVSGTATDDMGIDRVLVNGEMAELASTGNVSDPNEVAFNIELELNEGPTTIETVAMDGTGNQSSDTRIVTYAPPEVILTGIDMDIKPGSCKNPFNVKSRGVLPVVLLGSEDLDVSDIDINSLRLMGVAPVRSVIEDVAKPADP